MEVWKPIPLPQLSRYEISDEGNIRHIKHKKNVKFGNMRGYCMFRHKPSKKEVGGTYQVHRLVALTFILNLNNYPIVNHLNGYRGDNRVENLEWCTHKQNIEHGILRRKGIVKHKYEKIKNLYETKTWDTAKEFYEAIMNL